MKSRSAQWVAVLFSYLEAGCVGLSPPRRDIPQDELQNKVCKTQHPDITPIDKPTFSWGKTSDKHPRYYLEKTEKPYGKKVAKWQKEFFEPDADYSDSDLEWLSGSDMEIEPKEKDAPTIITLFYPQPGEANVRKPSWLYLKFFQDMANSKEQIIVYCPSDIGKAIRETIRDDKHLVIVDKYPTVWDIPTNDYQRGNFQHVQPKLFEQLDISQDKFAKGFNDPHLSAAYNAKAFVTYDAVMRNPFGTDKWIFIDFGLVRNAPMNKDGKPDWSEFMNPFLDKNKFARSIEMSRNSGVVIGSQKDKKLRPITDECWTNNKLIMGCTSFFGSAWAGNALGMLEFAVKYMKTVDDMDANGGLYTGREEAVLPFVLFRYPNTLFSMPYHDASPGVKFPLWPRDPNEKPTVFRQGLPMRTAYSGFGGDDKVPPINDPLATNFCPVSYKPRRGNMLGDKDQMKDDPNKAWDEDPWNVGNIVGPQLFLSTQPPKYTLGIGRDDARPTLMAASGILYGIVRIVESKQRDRKYGPPRHVLKAGVASENADTTDRENEELRYTF
ncbi:Uu.00g021970.m01.CDS01 [Anthostomella pinea]|uniref:Uu.00g021970.m01.CDS01 n=1 Tax=Anthostomella pinea TaxID=933095 RepID=A0AAI8VZT0_9PEZI|nr:Uu.00g021970.m01.CDS01 [Anthostomella pinea]